MLIIPPPAFRPRRGRSKQRPVVGPLVLVSAWFDPTGPVLQIAFDRAIDISGLDGSVIVVNDPDATANQLVGTGGAELVSPAGLQLVMVSIGPAEGPEQTLDAGVGNGILAVGDSAVWGGVSGLVLPFG